MPTYVAFLRAINLGATRKFPRDDVRRVTEAAGGTAVATHLNTGNVLLTSARRSAAAVARDLATAYAADRGFEVPTIVLTPAELAEIAATGRAIQDEHGPVANHYVSLYSEPPTAPAARAAEQLDLPGERCVVHGRAAHLLLAGNIHDAKSSGRKEFKALGEGTARTLGVLETLVQKWC